ncbi:hypothetical protein QAD02_020267 [Eretmocerus hayati]|uniref:Uncharacterized protein n=1 Tax=Eretmocerus hayati TaxID=131215 RepID=A0ACC2PLK3_9HYME|nr:hypothetical protein QAD02_020267 [Eretmocerus hayati]
MICADARQILLRRRPVRVAASARVLQQHTLSLGDVWAREPSLATSRALSMKIARNDGSGGSGGSCLARHKTRIHSESHPCSVGCKYGSGRPKGGEKYTRLRVGLFYSRLVRHAIAPLNPTPK